MLHPPCPSQNFARTHVAVPTPALHCLSMTSLSLCKTVSSWGDTPLGPENSQSIICVVLTGLNKNHLGDLWYCQPKHEPDLDLQGVCHKHLSPYSLSSSCFFQRGKEPMLKFCFKISEFKCTWLPIWMELSYLATCSLVHIRKHLTHTQTHRSVGQQALCMILPGVGWGGVKVNVLSKVTQLLNDSVQPSIDFSFSCPVLWPEIINYT